jgi:ribonuclease Z
MFELLFLGTSASVPSVERNHPGLLVSATGARILIDCGEGTQRQLLRSGAGFRRLRRILLTHAHLDHVLGIPGLISTLGLEHSSDGMIINGGPRTLQVVEEMLAGIWRAHRAPIPLELQPVADGQVIEMDGFTITCFPVRHRDTDSFGFSFESTGRRHLLPDRLTALGIPDGPVRGKLVQGLAVKLEDGRTIDPEDVLGPPEAGCKLVVVGDAETSEGLQRHVQNADVLVIEATFLQRDAPMARSYGHLTAAEAATLASASGVRRLILTHISGRYAPNDILAEASKAISNVNIAADFDRVSI